MKAFFKFSTIVILLLVLIGLVVVIAVSHSFYSGKGASVRFVNASKYSLQLATISVSGRSCSVKELGAGGEVNCYFQNLYDDGYTVSVTTEDGGIFKSDSMGYVTGGINFHDTITFNEDGSFVLVSDIGT